MQSRMVICDGFSNVERVDAATHYRDSRGEVSEITFREKRCPICGGTTLVSCANGVTRTFTIAHVVRGCVGEAGTVDGQPR